MVTASHNPRNTTGSRCSTPPAARLSYDKGLKDVEALVDGISAPASIPPRSFKEIDGLDAMSGSSRAPGRGASRRPGS